MNNRPLPLLIAALTMLCLPSMAWGKMFICKGEGGGGTVYTDQPCKGRYGEELGSKNHEKPSTMSVIPSPEVMPATPPAVDGGKEGATDKAAPKTGQAAPGQTTSATSNAKSASSEQSKGGRRNRTAQKDEGNFGSAQSSSSRATSPWDLKK